jgi:hypothetical protein
MAFMQFMFKAYVKSQKKASKSKKHKKRDYGSSDRVPTVNRKLGTAAQD